MHRLDRKTLEALAGLITGDNGPYYRKGYELHQFFRDAGLACPGHDGTTRKKWTLERLQEFNRSPDEVSKVIRRLADPREYRGEAGVLREVIVVLNRLLATEGIVVRLDGIRPLLEDVAPTIAPLETKPVTQMLEVDFGCLTRDGELRRILDSRWAEVSACIRARAFLSAVVMMGSILEGAFRAMMDRHPGQAAQSGSAPKTKDGRAKDFKEWTLSDMINVAHAVGWIQRDARDFSQVLREFRNLIHPWQQRAEGICPDEDTVKICFQVVQAALNDLTAYVMRDGCPTPGVSLG